MLRPRRVGSLPGGLPFVTTSDTIIMQKYLKLFILTAPTRRESSGSSSGPAVLEATVPNYLHFPKTMKTLLSLLVWFAAALAATICPTTVHAASVAPTGYTNGFGLQPAGSDWSTLSIGAANGDYSTAPGLDAAATAIAASSINTTLTADAGDPPLILSLAAWSSSGLYVQTRSTGNGATLLMCTLVNNIGGGANAVTISYDFAKPAAVAEEVEGHRAYYSLSGDAGSWTVIPEFSSANPGRLTATLSLAWAAGAPLYLLWADDNGAASDSPCQIDNFSVTATPGSQTPVAITTQPQSQTVAELAPVSFTVGLSGNLPPTWQWSTNGVAIPGATNLTYSIPSATLGYNGVAFQVIAQNVASNVTYFATSSIAILTVNTDTIAPVLLGAFPAGLGQVVVPFSERLALAGATNVANYSIAGLAGSLIISNATLDASQTNVILTVSPMTPTSNYTLTVNGVRDLSAAANQIAANSQASFTAANVAYADIGGPAIPGSVSSVAGGYNIAAGGTNILGAADQFTFSYQSVAGDFDFKVRIQTLSPSSPWAKAGLMARETLAANSRFAASFATPSIAGSFFESRLTNGADAVVAGSYPVNYPYTWLRLQRVGTSFTGYGSLDGQNWTLLSSVTLAGMPSSLYLGFAATSANAAQATAVQFRDYQSAAGGAIVPFVATREPLGPSTRRTGLVISEIMYHPKARTDGKVIEFIELYNSMSIFEDLSGYRITGDVSYTFAEGTIIQPGQFIVLAKIKTDVQSVYGISGVLQYGVTNGFNTNVVLGVTNITPNVDNSLNNAGGTVRLHNKAGAVLLDASISGKYPWPIQADGGGHSLVLARPSYGEGHIEAWAASDVVGGSPGAFDPIGSEPARNVVINEFLAHTDPPLSDMIELYNHGTTAVDLSGYWLSDDVGTNKFRIPDGTVLAARGFVSFTASTNPPPHLGFALSAAGEQIVLVNSNQTRVIDSLGYDGQENGISMGRYPDGAPSFRRLTAITTGTTNAAPLESPIVINEIMYNPITGNSDDEFVELYNRSGSPVNLGNWKFTSGIDYTFAPNTMLSPGAYLVVAKNATHLQANYNNLGATNLLGDYSGTLGNNGERLALSAPDYEVTTNGSGQVLTNVSFRYVVNEVTYGKGGKWGNWSDGGGSSLELIDSQADNRQPANWADSDDSTKSLWTSFEYTGPVDNVQSAQGNGDSLQLTLLGVGEAMIDDLEVRNTNNVNVLVNGSFESGISPWVPQGAHDRSFVEAGGFTGLGLHLMAGSRGDNGGNRIRSSLSSPITGGTATMRGKARWLRGFPEVLMRLRGGGLEAFGRLSVPANLGTPGARNSRAVTNAGPAIYDVAHNPPLPAASQAIVVTARVTDPNTVTQLVVKYRIEPATTFTTVSMTDNGTGADAVAGDGLFSAAIPGQSSGARAAFFIQATDGAGVVNLFPAFALVRTFPNDSPSHECVVRWGEVQMPGSFASYHLWVTDATRTRWINRPEKLNNSPLDGTFVYNNYRVVYNMNPQYGGSPWHLGSMNDISGGPGSTRVDFVANFPDDDLVLGTTDFVLNTVGNPSGNSSSDTSGMVEQTSYEMFKAIGVHYNYRRYIHVFVNGDQRSVTGNRTGNFIMEDSQQPNGDVVKEWHPEDADGQLYKIEDWFEFNDSATGFSNDDADLERRNTTINGKPNSIKLAPYRFMWRKRSVSAADSANDYTNLLATIDIISPASNPGISPLTDTMVKQFAQVVDFEQWMRIVAVQHAVGNWDTYGYNRGKNCYSYRPNFGKFQLFTWDIDFTMGSGGDGPTTGLFGASDNRIGAMLNTPETVRAYWRALLDIANGPMSNAYQDPLLDARAAAFYANNVNIDPAGVASIKAFTLARHNYILGQIPSAAFAVVTTNFTTSSNIVTLTGTAPVGVKFIEIDGINYAITWTGSQAAPTSWSLRLPMTVAGGNNFTLKAFDRTTNEIAGTTRTVLVNYTGVIEGAETNIVINEIMFNPLVVNAEYVELFNRSSSFTFDLSGWRLDGLGYTFPEGATIGPRSYLVLAKDRVNFGNAYGGGVPVFDQFTGSFQLDGETLTLVKPAATTNGVELVVDKVRYDGALPWPSAAASGTGSSYQLIDTAQDNSRAGNWSAFYSPPVYSGSSSTPAVIRDGWRFVSAIGTTPAGLTNLQRLVVYLGEAGSALVDDFALVPGTNAAVGTNYIVNGDFESPFTNGTTLATNGTVITNGWIFGTNYTNTLIVGDLVHAGTGAMKIIGASPGAVSQPAFNKIIYQFLTPTPLTNAVHTFSFWYWSTNSATNFFARLLNGNKLTSDPALGSGATNINIFITPSNYVPPGLVSPATISSTPGTTNRGIASLPAFPTLWINEVLADNLTGILDGAAERDPWIEIYNRSTNTVSLDGLYLSSTYTNLTNWAFPAGHSLTGGQFLVVFCDGQPGQTAGSELHTGFRLSSGSGSVALSRIYSNAPQVIDYVNYTALPGDRSFGSIPDGQSFDRQEFFYPTPRGTNDGRSGPLVVFINEWMAGNINYLADPADLNYEDWFELYNPATNTVDLAGYYLTDTLANKVKYLITTNGAHLIPPGGHLLVWADNETSQNTVGGVPRADLHVNFSLSLGGEAIGLFAADGTPIDAITFGAQTNDVSQGRFPDGGPNIYWFVTNRTPRAANFVPGLGNNPPVLGAIGGQSMFIGQTLTFTASAADPDGGQSLSYTLDGGAPAEASLGLFSGAFSYTPTATGTNTITVRVTDNGTPPLDDSETITVRVLSRPNFNAVTLNGHELNLGWFATAGRKYQVTYKDDLNAGPWLNYGGIFQLVSDGPISITDSTTNAPRRFFQLKIVP